MPWIGKHLAGFAVLDDFTALHDGDVVAHLRRHSQVMGDEDHGQLELLANFRKQVQHLGLH